MLTPLKVKIVAQACIIRYDRGEGEMSPIVASYGFDADNTALINDYIVSVRSDIAV